ncbi:MAG: hypothetical protein K0Q87_3102 [Neobacillus sp.]|nr:hypothetical protein [Neobacillus sp.]
MNIPTVIIRPAKEDESEILTQKAKMRIMLKDPTKLTSINSGLRKKPLKLCEVV